MKSALPLILLWGFPSFASAADEDVSDGRKAVEGNARQEYFLMDPSGRSEPEDGHKLLLVLPGGDGSAAFHPFVMNMAKHAAGSDYLVAQLVSVRWTPEQEIIWPTESSKVKDAEFTTEEFIAAVIDDVSKTDKVNPEHVYTLSWSSGGPAAYAASLSVEEIAGSFVAMSVFKPDELDDLSKAKGHRYYIYHSPDDRVCPIRMAEDAKARLTAQGADVEFVTYNGGHGWHGNIFGAIRAGLEWLEKR